MMSRLHVQLLRLLLSVAIASFATLSTAADELPTGDPKRGKIAFFTCYTCHYVGKSLPHHTGPNLFGIFARAAGTAAGYTNYSTALKDSGIRWTADALDAWLADPDGYLPGSSMVFIGVSDPQKRADLIAYLRQIATP